jgi:MFS superfamily sulfate permease-like transporter
MGDWGTLLPLVVGYIAVNKMDPAGLLVMMGLMNIALGLFYRLPMPLEPKKVIAAVAISQRWPASRIYASAIGLGLIWLFLIFTGLAERIFKITPKSVTRGIQLALGMKLGLTGLGMMRETWWLGLIAIVIILLLRESPKAPAALVLMALGLAIVAWQGKLLPALSMSFRLPPFIIPSWGEIWPAMVQAGFAQIPLSITNAVIATAALIGDYFPQRKVPERRLMLNMGVMNLVSPLFGGMPMCHGAGGLAGQYYFGGRTGGTSIIQGLIETGLGLFFAGSIATLFALFPLSIVGAMMVMVGLELAKFVMDIQGWVELPGLVVTVFFSVLVNMAVGFLAGIAIHHLLQRYIPEGHPLRERLPWKR